MNFKIMITLTDQEKTAVINCLKELDCCARCIVRFLGITNYQIYLEPEHYLNNFIEDCKDTICLDLPLKKKKSNPCRTCLDIFQNSTLERFAECITSIHVNEYTYKDFVTFVSFPKSILIRNHSMFVYLKERFPNVYNDLNGLENLNKVFRLSSSEIIASKINKMFNKVSNFILNFEIVYEDDETEVQNMKNITSLLKSDNLKDTSRNTILDVLKICDDKLFKEQFPVPPNIPIKETIPYIHCSSKSIWLGGRYLKFSRDMGQSPWIINNKLITEHSVQDIIFENVQKVLGCDKANLTFCASGREDADVRMLGNGRPFYIQIDNPKSDTITFEMSRCIEKEIFQSKLVAVVKLQEVFKSDIRRIKDGEENKRKHYHALCQTSAPDISKALSAINFYNSEILEIYQKTPLRVLHRRTQAVRKKCIYSMNAKIVAGYSDLIELELVTQAGTYVKEFVSGEFQRTNPSVSSIINHPIDVVALDVTKIELTWPETEA